MLHLPIGQRILRYSSLDDIAIWGLLALFLVGWPVTNPARSSVLKTSVRPLAASAVIRPTSRCGRVRPKTTPDSTPETCRSVARPGHAWARGATDR